MIKILSKNTIYDISTGIMYKRLSDGMLSLETIGSREEYFMSSEEECETLWCYLIGVGI